MKINSNGQDSVVDMAGLFFKEESKWQNEKRLNVQSQAMQSPDRFAWERFYNERH